MQDLIPPEPDFSARVLEYSDKMSEFLSEAAIGCQKINRIPRNSQKRQRFMDALLESFEIVGGVPRLALWADRNYTEFAKILGKQVPAMVQQLQINAGGNVQIISNLPPPAIEEDTAIEGEFSAVQDEKASSNDAGSGSQPEIREEGRDSAVGS